MPAVSQAQQRFAAMSKSAKGRKALKKSGKKPMPPGAAADFAKTGSMEGMPMHAQGKQALPTIPKKGPPDGGNAAKAVGYPKKKKRKAARAKDGPPQFGKPSVDKSGRF